jgi:diguanylate cyclase (GGDEF)-like protein
VRAVNSDALQPTHLYRLQQSSIDLHERSLLGGVFYLVGWLLVAAFGGAFENRPLVASAFAGGFALGTVGRFWLRRRALREPARSAAHLRALWLLLLVNSALWAAASVWALLDPTFLATDLVNLVTTVALATAFAQTYSVNLRLGIVGTTLIYLPPLLTVWTLPGMVPVAVAMSAHMVYLFAVLVRSHREYDRRLELDIALRVERDRYEELSRTDPLTGLANRRRFAEVLEQEFALAHAGTPLSLLVADIDHFKSINDRHGHASGDACLREVALRLRDAFAAASVVARLGGEEFGVLLPEDGAAAFGMADALRSRLAEQPLQVGDARIEVAVSIGIASFAPQRLAGSEDLFRAADHALYRAKAEGRNRVVAAG